MRSNFCESHLEEAALEWFEELGYEIVFARIWLPMEIIRSGKIIVMLCLPRD